MSDVKLTARIEGRNPRHVMIGVFQNGGKAGVLTVDAEHADNIVGLISAAYDTAWQRDKLLATCEAAMQIEALWMPPDAENDPNDDEEFAALATMRNSLRAAIAGCPVGEAIELDQE